MRRFLPVFAAAAIVLVGLFVEARSIVPGGITGLFAIGDPTHPTQQAAVNSAGELVVTCTNCAPSSFDSTANNGNTLLGTNAGQHLDGAGSEHLTTAVGYNALGAATLNDGTLESTAIGWNSQSSITTGSQNTSLGINTLGNCTLCIHNIAIGTDSMRNTVSGAGASSQSGQYNIGIGVTTIINSNTWHSIAIGESAMRGVNTDSTHENIGIGFQTMEGLSGTSANQDIAIGDFALTSMTSASGDVFVGYQAGLSATTDFWDVVIGWYAGNSAVGGYANVFLGAQAGQHVTSGNENILIGYLAGGTTLTTGTNNVLIGTSMDTAAADTSNTIGIGTGGGAIISATGTDTPSTSATVIAGTLSVVGVYKTGSTSGVSCAVNSPAHLTAVNGIVTVCN